MKLAEAIFNRLDYRITSKYGSRIHPVTLKPEFHKGTDYGTQGEKWPQYALEEGIVIGCGKDKWGANALYVWVRYPRLNIDVLHYHLDRISVVKGQTVRMNDLIGFTGRSGRATGIHLHLQVRNSHTRRGFDPESYDYKMLTNNTEVLNDFSVGDKVKITGTHYATGQKIPLWVKLKTHTVGRLNGSRILLKEIVSWVYDNDIKKEV